VLSGRYLLVEDGTVVAVGGIVVRVAVGDGKGMGWIVSVKVAVERNGVVVVLGNAAMLQETRNRGSVKTLRA
jgi:hypothetical protein